MAKLARETDRLVVRLSRLEQGWLLAFKKAKIGGFWIAWSAMQSAAIVDDPWGMVQELGGTQGQSLVVGAILQSSAGAVLAVVRRSTPRAVLVALKEGPVAGWLISDDHPEATLKRLGLPLRTISK